MNFPHEVSYITFHKARQFKENLWRIVFTQYGQDMYNDTWSHHTYQGPVS